MSPEARAKELLVDAIADIARAPDMAALESAYNAGRVIVQGFDSLKPALVAAKDKRKHELTHQEQSA
ncbi:hypothetical protein D3C80_2175190 [compost metagenome]